MNKQYQIVSDIIHEGIPGAVVWGGGSLARYIHYRDKAAVEKDPLKKQHYLNKARRWKLAAIGGGIGGALPGGGFSTGPAGTIAGYAGGALTEK